jgi:hypothetical protein
MIPIPVFEVDNSRIVTGVRKTCNLDDPVEVSNANKSYSWMHTGLVLTKLGKYALTFYNDHAGDVPKDFGVLVDDDTALVEIIQRDHAELLEEEEFARLAELKATYDASTTKERMSAVIQAWNSSCDIRVGMCDQYPNFDIFVEYNKPIGEWIGDNYGTNN